MRLPAATVALAGLVVLVGAGLSGCSSTLGYAALVDGATISQSAVNTELAYIAKNTQYVKTAVDQAGGPGPLEGTSAGTYNKAYVALVLDRQVDFAVIRKTLAAHKSVPTKAQMTTASDEVSQAYGSAQIFNAFPAAYRNILITRQAQLDDFVKIETADLTGDKLKQFYQANQNNYVTEACVRHILFASRTAAGQVNFPASLAAAQKVKALLDAGGDFAALAMKYSQDNGTGGSAAQGGAITGNAADGCLTSSDLQQISTSLPTFAEAVVELPVNQVSAPVETQLGYHLIEVTSRVVEPLDSSVASDLDHLAAGQKLNALLKQAHVKVNPEFGSFDRTANPAGDIPGVVPPVVPSLGTTTTSTIPVSGN